MLDDSFRIRYKTVPFAVHTKTDSAVSVDMHNHAEFEILQITRGTSAVTVSGKTYTVQAGDMVFINPMEVHSVNVLSKDCYSHNCICFDVSLIGDKNISSALKNGNLRVRCVVTKENSEMEKLNSFFNGAYTAHLCDERFSALEITSYMSLMFACLFKNFLVKGDTVKTKNDIFCTKVLDYIAVHYGEELTSANTASALFYDQSYFCRTFKQNFGKSFSEYLNMYRVAVARMLLENTDSSVTEISAKAGFNTPSYFAKCFKEHVGVLPSKYK